jgi:hypothetical protein
VRLAIEPAGVAADEQEITDLNAGNVMSRRYRRRWHFDPKFC